MQAQVLQAIEISRAKSEDAHELEKTLSLQRNVSKVAEIETFLRGATKMPIEVDD